MANWARPHSLDLNCHVCGYDLRAHSEAAVCPECGTAVSKSREVAAVPIRPAWRDSDPRWRRRMLLGVWLIVLMPTMRVLHEFGITDHIPVPSVLGPVRSLNDTYFGDGGVFDLVAFSVGIALLFSPERGRRRTWLDGTYRWGVLGCYLVMLLGVLSEMTMIALVAGGSAARFMSIPTQFQPDMTGLLATLSSSYLRFAPMPDDRGHMVLVTCSRVVILLACVPVVAALRSAGARFWAYVIVAPILGLAVAQLVLVIMAVMSVVVTPAMVLNRAPLFFDSGVFASGLEQIFRPPFSLIVFPSGDAPYFYLEAIKWGTFLVIAVWLTIAQIRAKLSKPAAS
jgi:hypothetical protein